MMTFLHRTTALACVLLLLATVSARGQSACRPADSVSTYILRWVTQIATGTDSVYALQRSNMRIPQVPASQITYVTDKTVCNKALSPYNANSVMQDASTGTTVPPSGKVYVVKVGTVYVVHDPAKKAGEFMLFVTLDRQYRLLWAGLG